MSALSSSCPSCHGQKRYGGSACAFCGGSGGGDKKEKKAEASKAIVGEPQKTTMNTLNAAMISSTCKQCRRKSVKLVTSTGDFCSSDCRRAHCSANPCESTVTASTEKRSNGSLYEIFSHKPDVGAPTIMWRDWYRRPGPRRDAVLTFESSFSGRVLSKKSSLTSSSTLRQSAVLPVTNVTNVIDIAYTVQGDKGPIVVLLPGVPVNRYELKNVQALLAPFCRTIAIDPLNMGESSMVLERESYLYKDDSEYIHAVVQKEYPGESYNVLGTDWGGGMAIRLAEQQKAAVSSLGVISPVFSSNFPVPDIQAVGRLKLLLRDEKDWPQFVKSVQDFDSRAVGIIRAIMVYNSEKINNAGQRGLLLQYSDQDYEKPGAGTPTLGLNYWGIAGLVERAYALYVDQLKAAHPVLNPEGVDVTALRDKPTFICWGQDPMMPNAGAHRMPHEYELQHYCIHILEKARHLIAIDRPYAVAERYLDFLRGVAGQQLADVFLGYPDTPKGDEKQVLAELRKKYDIAVSEDELW